MSFAQLLREVEKVEGLERIRFMTPHPKDLSDELIEVMATSKKVCKHMHLPMQSGSSRLSNPTSLTTSNVSLKSSSVSPGNPTIISVVKDTPGILS